MELVNTYLFNIHVLLHNVCAKKNCMAHGPEKEMQAKKEMRKKRNTHAHLLSDLKIKYMNCVCLLSCALVFVANAVAVTVTVHYRERVHEWLMVDNCRADALMT